MSGKKEDPKKKQTEDASEGSYEGEEDVEDE